MAVWSLRCDTVTACGRTYSGGDMELFPVNHVSTFTKASLVQLQDHHLLPSPANNILEVTSCYLTLNSL